MRPATLGVIGLGAIGGSLAWQARRAGVRVLGWSPRPAQRARAVELGALDDAPPRADDVARRADLLVLAAPPQANEELLTRLGPVLPQTSLATDVATVKRGVARRADTLGLGARFAGSHPAVTVEGQGFDAARADLFAGALVYVCPIGQELSAAREVAHFWEAVVGATTVIVEPSRHDAQAVWTRHLARVIACTLGAVVEGGLPAGVRPGPALSDQTRAASGAPHEAGALIANADNLVAAVDALVAELHGVRLQLADQDVEALTRQLARAAAWRRGLGD